MASPNGFTMTSTDAAKHFIGTSVRDPRHGVGARHWRHRIDLYDKHVANLNAAATLSCEIRKSNAEDKSNPHRPSWEFF
jgi:hypothetical protein